MNIQTRYVLIMSYICRRVLNERIGIKQFWHQAVLVICALGIVLGGIVISSPIAYAASTQVKSKTTQTQETIHLSDQACATLKKKFPTKANDPNLCILIHKVTITETPVLPNARVSPQDNWWQCYQGSKTFTDDTYGLGQYDIRLNTIWNWSGACGVPPTLTSATDRSNCFMNWGILWYEDSQICTSYTTSIPSRAAYYRSTIKEGIDHLAFLFNVSLRRECYTGNQKYDSNDGKCDFNTWS